MEFILYPLFIILSLLIAAELNGAPTAPPPVEPTTPTPTYTVAEAAALVPAPPAMAKAVESAPRLVIPVAEIAEPADVWVVESCAGKIDSVPIDWSAWNIRESRWVATRMGIKGAGRMTKSAVQEAIAAHIA